MHTLTSGWTAQRRENKSLTERVSERGYLAAMSPHADTASSTDAQERPTDTTDPTNDR
jgi:hypothetical protein